MNDKPSGRGDNLVMPLCASRIRVRRTGASVLLPRRIIPLDKDTKVSGTQGPQSLPKI